jgi:hypothetical protein
LGTEYRQGGREPLPAGYLRSPFPGGTGSYKDMKTPYVQPFLADLTEKAEQSRWHKRNIVMPLDAQKLNIRLEAYHSVIWKNLEGQVAS